jgi:hypothetical protein
MIIDIYEFLSNVNKSSVNGIHGEVPYDST